mmetsp:Transcript_173739/g.556820  ORF Transcript_173739/g.556820 Transcript_173739/m.556820 type:complete len:267 (-) Transcript_173739:2212-3012(-)
MAAPMASSADRLATAAMRMRLSAKSLVPSFKRLTSPPFLGWPGAPALASAASTLRSVASVASAIFSSNSAEVVLLRPASSTMTARSRMPISAMLVLEQLFSLRADSMHLTVPSTARPKVRNCTAASWSSAIPWRVSSRNILKVFLEGWFWTSLASSPPRMDRCAQAATRAAADIASLAKPTAPPTAALGASSTSLLSGLPPSTASSTWAPTPSFLCFMTFVYACWIAWKRRVLPMPALSGCSLRERLRYCFLTSESETLGPSRPRM